MVIQLLRHIEKQRDYKKAVDENGNIVTRKSEPESPEYQREYKWRNIIILTYLHGVAIWGIFHFYDALLYTAIYNYTIGALQAIGITAGAHRLWTHRAYKARKPLRVMLMVFQTFAFQNHLFDWCRDHRVHHKYTDTDADPHNSRRGFFFSHVGWLLVNKHPEVIKKGKTIDLSDLEQDEVVMWQKRNYMWWLPTMGFLVHVLIPYFFFGETFKAAWEARVVSYVITLNLTWLLNSGAHMWGSKPYDKSITATDTLIMGISTMGEGWHNYHHVFPWDYKTSELSKYGYNMTIPFIDFMAKIGWAYDLKTVSKEMIRARMIRTGDGTNQFSNIKDLTEDKTIAKLLSDCHADPSEAVWGWEDRDMKKEEREWVTIINSTEEKNTSD